VDVSKKEDWEKINYFLIETAIKMEKTISEYISGLKTELKK
jgi:hypothetical protein